MDRISQLSDTLLLRILSELPTAEVVETMVLSKRWLPLWKSVPHIDFDDDSYEDIDTGRFSRFVDRSLILHKAPIETLHFELTQSSTVDDIGVWIEMAVQRHVRDLSIYIDCTSSTTPVTVPRSLYTGCGMLVTLKLKSVTLADASTLPSFSTLKYLFLLFVKYPGEEFVRRLLFSCGVLEHLDVEQCFDDNVTIFTVKVPSLKSAILRKSKDRYIDDEDGFVIDAPSLELLDVYNSTAGFCTIESAMPNIVKANVVVNHGPSEILSAITSVKRLYLCLSYAKDAYPVGSVFPRLVCLTICTSEIECFNLLMCLLRDSPSLKSLKLQLFCIRDQGQRSCWNEPSSVPACLLSSLETFEWVNYEGTEEEKEVVAFILRSGRCLKKVNISSETTDSDKKLEML
ncbi:hypothetical protein BRARA_B01274 [Brassica rapa]|uniref:FBD domain-containing protein n=1 Tax=Brassica campestris TaxID=3711 RepID=M4F3G7_BRACM|nr:putative FBD-associated F-box protein At5g50270 isoform X1 [Brassica rapa]RID74162.1 hypothetical protein BRARA_B01274 [Brassica rapa]